MSGTQTHEDFFRYTSGRWLWDEEARFQERYRRFDVMELQRIATASVGADSCVSMTKFAEGAFHKVFRLVMDNSTVLIARVPNPIAGPPFLTTASEVATMDFARRILDLPVPKVTCWSAQIQNPVGSEYIVMEEASGTQLSEAWDSMELSTKLKVVADIVAIQTKLLSISFTLYGSLYFAADAFQGCRKAEVETNSRSKAEVESRYVIGPVADRMFWNQDLNDMDVNHGPWESPEDYLTSIGNREMIWLSQDAKSRTTDRNIRFLSHATQHSAESHISLYKKFSDVVPYLLPRQPSLVRPTIWHADLHASNIFVTGDSITSLIDWQNTWTGPLFLQVRQPRLVDYNGSILLELPEDYKRIADADEKERIRNQVERSIILWTYEMDSKEANPDVHAVFQTPYGRTRREVVDFASDSRDGDLVPFRECLIRLARDFDKLGVGATCPIKFSANELQEHARDGEGWNERADFWDRLDGIVATDGWTSHEMYEQALEIFIQLREQGLQNLTGKEREDFEHHTRWAVRPGLN